MDIKLVLVTLTVLCTCVVEHNCDKKPNYDDQVQLLKDLFESVEYSKHIRPVKHTNNVLDVSMEFDLITLADLDEKDQTMTVSALLKLRWKDYKLSWDPEAYGGITNFLVEQKAVWVPDVTMGNSILPNIHLGDKKTLVRISNDGMVDWEPSILVETDCDIIVSFYPFDTQQCSVEFRTQRSHNSEINLIVATHNKSLLEKYNEDGTWRMDGYSLHRDVDDEHNEHLVFNFLFARRTTFFVVNIILPVVFLSLTASLVFALPLDEGEKMGTSITVLLAYAVYLSIVSEYLPDTSLDISLLAVYLTMLLGLTAFSVVVTTFILRLHHKDADKPVPDYVVRMTVFFQKIGCYYNPIKRGSGAICDVDMTWTKVARTLDWFFFIFFSTVTMLTTVLFMLILVVGSHVSKPELPTGPEHLN